MKKFKSIFTIILFASVLFTFTGAHILLPDGEISYAERRELEEFPSLSAENVLSYKFSEEIEGYFLDQFPIRETFRYMNSFVRMSMLRQLDVNGLWVEDEHIFKYEGDLDKKQIEYGCNVINNVISTYLDGMNVYYSVIPEKSYFAGKDRPKFDYTELLSMLDSGMQNAEYIDIFDTVTLDSYYRTDSHWSQEKILPVSARLSEAMSKMPANFDYETKEIPDFHGVYYGQAAFLGVEPDTIRYLTCDELQSASVYGIPSDELKNKFGVENTLSKEIYALDKLDGKDAYDIFLSGGQPVVTLELDEGNGKELVIFRDSFSSSLAPLMLGAYQKVTLVDLRYIPSSLIGDYVEFNDNQDALFLYSASMLNSSMLMR